ncbi:extensin family protein [uncultured Sphingomonas sp.]|uniref:extensin family protein n=1 Tax=uncultured Sphingomonas sp. TaxID=158754 RepID=UPI0025FC8505|nr:extensin family protein [uncultured Sphingomonas sp.]
MAFSRVFPLAVLALPLLLSACIFGSGGGDKRPAPAPTRPRGSPPITLNRPTPRETQQCFTDLSRAGVRFSAMPDRDYGGGCIVEGAVQLIDIGVPVGGIKGMRCPLARAFTGWVQYAVAPAARQILGSDLVRVDTFGTYVCRAIVGSPQASTKLSEHGRANAVDVSGFVLRDGRRITILKDWQNQDPAVRKFLETIHGSACRRFATVLSPNYNYVHRDHFHLDMGRGPFCA